MYRNGSKAAVRVTRWILNAIGVPLDGNIVAAHKCDNPYCINPDHLFAATYRENMMDCVVKGRHFWTSRNYCSRGHEYTEGTTRLTPDRKHRLCLICARTNAAKNRKKISDLAKKFGIKGTKYKKVTAAALLAVGACTEEEING